MGRGLAVLGVVLAAATGGYSQSAAQIGGRPPQTVVTALCSIGDVFGKL